MNPEDARMLAQAVEGAAGVTEALQKTPPDVPVATGRTVTFLCRLYGWLKGQD